MPQLKLSEGLELTHTINIEARRLTYTHMSQLVRHDYDGLEGDLRLLEICKNNNAEPQFQERAVALSVSNILHQENLCAHYQVLQVTVLYFISLLLRLVHNM